MNLQLRSKGLRVSREFHEFIERRMFSALRRFGARLSRIRIGLVRTDRSGRDRVVCRIRATTADGEVLIEEDARNRFAAVARACARANHALSRRFGKRLARRWADRHRGESTGALSA